MAGATSELGQVILKMLNLGAKHVQAGEVSPAAEKNTIEQLLMKNAQNSQQMQQMKPQGGAPQGMPAAGASPSMPRAA